ncbi:MAG TPA: Xaa-Pro peptidase family protein [Gaiellaceae bacterium]|nr:Xaa-Pro peptidase family protein [Gaiellaceae bacterium]
MADVLIFADSVVSPEMRHAVPILIPDPFLYVEKDGKRFTVSTAFEVARIAELGIEARPWEDFGYDELIAQGLPREEIVWLHVNLDVCRELGVDNAIVPRSFPISVADHMRANGIELKPDHGHFSGLRRVKNDAELAGIRRAQKAAEAGMSAARALLARAEPSNDHVNVDGEPLTSERLKAAIRRVFSDHGMSSDDFIVSHGPQTAIGHELGSGPIAPNEPVVIDLWPRDPESACYADMTRTYVVGDPSREVVEYHRLVKEALDRSFEATKAGVPGSDVYNLVCELFEEHGQKTTLSKKPGEVLDTGFIHGLGHGVGLEVHEAPSLGRGGTGDLVAGDVVTLEPGLYRAGFGGCRLEDLVLVTEDGAENLTDFPYDLTP